MTPDPITIAIANFDYNSTQSKAVLPVQGRNKATVQVILNSVAVGSLVLTIRKSNDQNNWTDVSTLSAAGVSATIEVAGFAFIGVFVTTALGSACVAPLVMYAEYI